MPCCARSTSGYCCALLCEVDLRVLLCLVVRGRPQSTVVPCCARSTSGYCCALLCEVDLRLGMRLLKVNCSVTSQELTTTGLYRPVVAGVDCDDKI